MKTRKFTAMLLALAMVLSLCSVSVLAADTSVTYGGVTLGFGDPAHESTWPENAMGLEGSNGTYTAVYEGSDAAYYYPDTLSLYADCGDTSLTLTGDGVKFATYVDAEEMLHNSITTEENGADLFTLKIQSAGTVTITGGSSTVTIQFSAPKSDYPESDGTPTGLNGYLPIGQYANGNMWGSPYSDGTASAGNTPKVVGGYSGTGVSLGAAGGYVEYDMNVTNSDTTPYGVDFIVYGNAFVGNPEAASVKVYGTPVNGTAGWYELAGSLYYADETLRNVDVTYKKVTSASGEFTSAGIWYKIERNGVTLRSWTKFNTNTNVAWWPEESEGYLGANGVWGGVNDVVISADQTQITYQNVTLVRDTDATADYAFGYADITPNGTNYGTPVNPYTYNTTGGNAYDISWAVDENGEPVRLTTISKIRVYTSAALNVSSGDAPIFTVPSIFGETSTEVCGIYAVTGSGSGVGAVPTVELSEAGDIGLTAGDAGTTVNLQGLEMDSVTISVSGGTYIFINGVATSTATIDLSDGAVHNVQIIVQSGTASPYIVLLQLAA
ncbi:hypothetical protein [Intestinimonas timonensis]|uniref:hypothetical protein n=1 Tax=Intestinimonas timonensis TaxID=1689270 RepID=UPI0010307FE3|nr:hypothetical protein [Intestinimonas timonensis]